METCARKAMELTLSWPAILRVIFSIMEVAKKSSGIPSCESFSDTWLLMSSSRIMSHLSRYEVVAFTKRCSAWHPEISRTRGNKKTRTIRKNQRILDWMRIRKTRRIYIYIHSMGIIYIRVIRKESSAFIEQLGNKRGESEKRKWLPSPFLINSEVEIS